MGIWVQFSDTYNTRCVRLGEGGGGGDFSQLDIYTSCRRPILVVRLPLCGLPCRKHCLQLPESVQLVVPDVRALQQVVLLQKLLRRRRHGAVLLLLLLRRRRVDGRRGGAARLLVACVGRRRRRVLRVRHVRHVLLLRRGPVVRGRRASLAGRRHLVRAEQPPQRLPALLQLRVQVCDALDVGDDGALRVGQLLVQRLDLAVLLEHRPLQLPDAVARLHEHALLLGAVLRGRGAACAAGRVRDDVELAGAHGLAQQVVLLLRHLLQLALQLAQLAGSLRVDAAGAAGGPDALPALLLVAGLLQLLHLLLQRRDLRLVLPLELLDLRVLARHLLGQLPHLHGRRLPGLRHQPVHRGVARLERRELRLGLQAALLPVDGAGRGRSDRRRRRRRRRLLLLHRRPRLLAGLRDLHAVQACRLVVVVVLLRRVAALVNALLLQQPLHVLLDQRVRLLAEAGLERRLAARRRPLRRRACSAHDDVWNVRDGRREGRRVGELRLLLREGRPGGRRLRRLLLRLRRRRLDDGRLRDGRLRSGRRGREGGAGGRGGRDFADGAVQGVQGFFGGAGDAEGAFVHIPRGGRRRRVLRGPLRRLLRRVRLRRILRRQLRVAEAGAPAVGDAAPPGARGLTRRLAGRDGSARHFFLLFFLLFFPFRCTDTTSGTVSPLLSPALQ
eukprot:Rhum_TRINITY_DN14387_c2_g1::Rhum_TRINITY_DN14387_c2_g1_i1::g.86918::m.86918